MNDRVALLDFYDCTVGKFWKQKWNWCLEERCSKWHGVKVEEGRVIAIMLNDNFLRGKLDEWESIRLLTHVKVFSLYRNNLVGPLPSKIGILQNLGELNLSWNNFTGNTQLV